MTLKSGSAKLPQVTEVFTGAVLVGKGRGVFASKFQDY